MLSCCSHIRAVAWPPPVGRSTRQMRPARESASTMTPGASRQLPFSPPARPGNSRTRSARGLTGLPAAQIEPVQIGPVRGEGVGGIDAEDVGLCLDDPHRRLVEGVNQDRFGRNGRGCRWDVPELLVQDRGHQDRAIGSYREIFQEGVRRENGHGGELGQRHYLSLHDSPVQWFTALLISGRTTS